MTTHRFWLCCLLSCRHFIPSIGELASIAVNGCNFSRVHTKYWKLTSILRQNSRLFLKDNGPTWLSSFWETWDVPFTSPGTLKTSFKGQTGYCSARPGLESDGLSRGTLGHPQSPIKGKSGPTGRRGLERVVQSISPNAFIICEEMFFDYDRRSSDVFGKGPTCIIPHHFFTCYIVGVGRNSYLY